MRTDIVILAEDPMAHPRQAIPPLLALTLVLTACSGTSDSSAGTAKTDDDTSTATDSGSLDGSAADSSDPDSQPGVDAVAPTDADQPDATPWQPPPICHTGSGWDGQSPTFTDVTVPSGIGSGDAHVLGVRLGTVDLDGDLYPEIVARRNVIGQRSDLVAGKQHAWLLRNDSAIKGKIAFADHTVGSGLLATRDGVHGRPVHIVVFGDVDNDGDVDVFAGMHVNDKSQGEAIDASEVLLNDGKGVLQLQAKGSFTAPKVRRGLSGASFVDYDRDGMLDLWLGYTTWGQAPTPDLLFAGDGKGAYSDVTVAEGLMTLPYGALGPVAAGTSHRNTWSAGACDLNNDGHPDLFTTSYGRYFNGLWLGGQIEGDKRFVDVMHSSKFGRDDNDDWTSNINAQCYCQENPKADECDKAPKPTVNCAGLKAGFGGKYRWNHTYDRQPWRLGGTTGTAICADIDRDGDLDIMQFDIVHGDVGPSSDPSHLMENDGAKKPIFAHLDNKKMGLQRVYSHPWGWNEGDMTGAVFDFDNDGRLDILIASSDYPGTRASLFHQKEDGTFAELPFAKAIDHRRAHGVAVADFDRDGDLDVALGHSRARCKGATDCPPDEQVHIYRNDAHGSGKAGGNWLQLQLVGGAGSNRSAIGARVTVHAGGVAQTAELDGGHGHFGIHNDLVLHFGLGSACTIGKIEVRWPDKGGTVQTFTGVQANYLVRLVQGEQAVAYPLAVSKGAENP